MKPSLDAIELFREVIKDYKWTASKEPAMLRMFVCDRKQFRKVLQLYRSGKWREAAEYAGHMDTTAREHIPQKIWDDIQSV